MIDSALNMAQVERIRKALLQDEVLRAMQREYQDGKTGGVSAEYRYDNQRWQDIVEVGLQKAGLS